MSALQTVEAQHQMMEIEERRFKLENDRANALCHSAFFPDTLKGDLASAVIVYDLSARMNISVMEVAQSVYIIYGRPSFSTSFLVARLNQSGLIRGSLRSIVSEDLQSCRCEAIDSATGELYVGMTVTMKMAHAEQWVSKKGSKWQTMPELMLRKRAQSFFIKEFYPQTMFGTQSSEEMEDVEAVATQSAYTSPALQQAVQAKPKTTARMTKAQLEAQNVAEANSIDAEVIVEEIVEEPIQEVQQEEVLVSQKLRLARFLRGNGLKDEEMIGFMSLNQIFSDEPETIEAFLENEDIALEAVKTFIEADQNV